MTKTKYTSAAEAVREVLATTNKGVIFSGYDLKNRAVKLYPKGLNMYVDTFLREMRQSCSDQYELISRSESLYRKIKPSRLELRAEELKKYRTYEQKEFNFDGVN